MKADARLVKLVLDLASARFSEPDTTATTQVFAAYIEGLLSIVRNPELSPVLREVPDSLIKCCEASEAAIAGNSGLERQAGSLQSAAELLVGYTHTNK